LGLIWLSIGKMANFYKYISGPTKCIECRGIICPYFEAVAVGLFGTDTIL
jgi:hypothetical protein